MKYGDREVDLSRVDIEFRDVYFRYPGAKADTLKGVNLHIRAGERLAVVGVLATLVKLAEEAQLSEKFESRCSHFLHLQRNTK